MIPEADAAIAKAMLARGDRQQDIAHWFGENHGRIAEISTGQRYPNLKPARGRLPPPGPYAPGRDVAAATATLGVVRALLEVALAKLAEIEAAALASSGSGVRDHFAPTALEIALAKLDETEDLLNPAGPAPEEEEDDDEHHA